MALLCLQASFAFSNSFRSNGSGNWDHLSTWQVFSGSWIPATQLPSGTDDVIIQSGHIVDIIQADAQVGTLDVQSGATLRLLGASFALQVFDGNPAGADFMINGTFEDHANSGGGNGVFFNGSTWQLGSGATFVKTNNSSAARYRDHYEGGMQNIPASANWIIRYIGIGNPSFSTINTYYPNLTFESFAGHWNPAIGASRFQGSGGFATVLGQLNVGGSGTGSVQIYNQNTNPTGLRVLGNCIVQNGSVITNQGSDIGTGFEIGGSMIISGTFVSSGGTLTLNGIGPQLISGIGTITLDEVNLNNPNGVEIFRQLDINTNLNIWQGQFRLNNFDLRVLGDIAGASSAYYIKTNGMGQLIRPLPGSQTFPIGQDTYNMVIIEGGFVNEVGVRVEDRVMEEGDTGSQLTSDLVNRTWWVTGTGLTNYNLTLEWQPNNELAGFDRTACYVSYHRGLGWENQEQQWALGSGPFLLTQNNIPEPGAFTIGSNGVLPVQLVSFSAKAGANGNELHWATAQEVNFDYFELQKSNSGLKYLAVAKLDGNGTFDKGSTYQYLDQNPTTGTNYYRLRMVDKDGTVAYSDILVVDNQEIELSKTPIVKNELQLPEAWQGQKLLLLNRQGEKIQILQSLSNRLTIPDLPPGMYWLVNQNKRSIEKRSFIKI